MKLLWKSEPLQLPDMTRLEDDEDFEDHKKLAKKREELADKRTRDYHLLIKLLHKFDYTNTRIYTSQLHPSTFLPLKWQFRDAPKSMRMFIPDIRQYLAENGITDIARQDAFIDAKEAIGCEILVRSATANQREPSGNKTACNVDRSALVAFAH